MDDRETRSTPPDAEERSLTGSLAGLVVEAVGLGAAGGFGMKAGADAYDAVKEAVTPKPKAKSPVILPPGADRE